MPVALGKSSDVPGAREAATRHATSSATPGARNVEDEAQSVTVSAAFYPTANILSVAPDAVMLSADRVFFYVHSEFLRHQSTNNFNHILPAILHHAESEHQIALLPVHEHSHVLNVILHTVYGLSCIQFSPTNDVLSAAVAGLQTYGMQLDVHLAPETPLFALLAARTPSTPLFVYTLAAQYNLYELAAQASAFLLSLKVSAIDGECADRMGPIYLNRLLALQQGRVEALKEILRAPPSGHPLTDHCNAESQAGLARAWMLTAAYLIWEARPELTTTSMEVTFESVAGSIRCEACKAAFSERLAQALNSWALQTRTI